MNPDKPIVYDSDRLKAVLVRAVDKRNLDSSLKPPKEHRDGALIDAMIGHYLDLAESHGAVDSREFEFANGRVSLLVDYLTASREDNEIYSEVINHPQYKESQTPENWLRHTISLGAKACSDLLGPKYDSFATSRDVSPELKGFLEREWTSSKSLFTNSQISLLRATLLADTQMQQRLTYEEINRACDSIIEMLSEVETVVQHSRYIPAERIKTRECKFFEYTLKQVKQANGPDKFTVYDAIINNMALRFQTDTKTQYEGCDRALAEAMANVKYHLKTSRHATWAR